MGEPLTAPAGVSGLTGLTGQTGLTTEALFRAVRDPARDPVPALLAALDQPDAAVRQEALRYLGGMPTHRAVGALARVLRADPEDHLRWEAAEALGVIGGPAAVPALLAAITDPEPAVRLCAAEALGMVGGGDPRVAAALCCLLTDADAGVRMFTLEALARVGDAAALPALRTRVAAERRTPEVRVWVHYALHALGDVPFPLGEAFRLLRRGSVRTRVSAARALSQLDVPWAAGTRVRRALRAAHARETGAGVRECLARLLEDAAAAQEAAENPETGPRRGISYSAGTRGDGGSGDARRKRADRA